MFEPAFMQLALVASVATGVSLGVLGVYLVIRRVVFFGLVLANAATLGAAIAEIAGWPPEALSLAAGIAAAAALGEVGTSPRVSDESLMGWAYTAASAATVLILSRAAGGSADTLHLLFGNVLAVQAGHARGLLLLAAVIVALQLLFSRRFLLVTFDAEAARVAGVKTAWWSLALNLSIGAAAAAAVHEIGALPTFALLSLPAMAALLVTSSIRAAFLVAAGLGVAVPSLALAAAFYLDLPPGPACAAFLALTVALAAAVSARTDARRHMPATDAGAARNRRPEAPVSTGRV
jgi:zinc transport system permease protein